MFYISTSYRWISLVCRNYDQLQHKFIYSVIAYFTIKRPRFQKRIHFETKRFERLNRSKYYQNDFQLSSYDFQRV